MWLARWRGERRQPTRTQARRGEQKKKEKKKKVLVRFDQRMTSGAGKMAGPARGMDGCVVPALAAAIGVADAETVVLSLPSRDSTLGT